MIFILADKRPNKTCPSALAAHLLVCHSAEVPFLFFCIFIVVVLLVPSSGPSTKLGFPLASSLPLPLSLFVCLSPLREQKKLKWKLLLSLGAQCVCFCRSISLCVCVCVSVCLCGCVRMCVQHTQIKNFYSPHPPPPLPLARRLLAVDY